MAGSEDRLSDLPDDLLRRILHFVPLKEAASTTALSRRWRAPLWLSSGAVNLETGVEKYYHYHSPDDKAHFFSQRDDFVSAVVAELAADVPVTRLTLRVVSDLRGSLHDSWSWDRHHKDKIVSRYTKLINATLSHRTARRVEELRIAVKDPTDYLFGNRQECLYTVEIHSLPLKTLRVLQLANCKGLLYQRESAAVVVLPRLSSLYLSHSPTPRST
jgi:hypothetical protein